MMISRVAEVCFWMLRHVERADAMARLLRVNRSFVLDAPLAPARKWTPLIVAVGEEDRFTKAFSRAACDDGECVQAYMTWDTRNPVSIATAVYWARENALTIRDVVSLELWDVLNDHWHWLRGGLGRRLYLRDTEAFYRHVSQTAAMFQGVCHNTMLHDTPFDFMRLGMLLERAGQTARVLDVHHHTFRAGHSDRPGDATAPGSIDEGVERMHWLALLRLCSGTSPFLKRVRSTPTGKHVTAFLTLDADFPRSIFHCLDRAKTFLERLRPDSSRGVASFEALSALHASLLGVSSETLEGRGLHTELTRLVDGTLAVCDAIHADYFDPSLGDALRAERVAQQEARAASPTAWMNA